MLDQPALKKLKELGATYDLAPPGPVELAEIVRAPAEAAGLVFETDAATGERLDARLLRDADRPDMLPLVQLALSRLFEGRETVGGEIRLPLKVYESSAASRASSTRPARRRSRRSARPRRRGCRVCCASLPYRRMIRTGSAKAR